MVARTRVKVRRTRHLPVVLLREQKRISEQAFFMFKLGQICENSEAKILKQTYRHQLVPAL